MFWGRSVLKQATKIPFRKYNIVLIQGNFQTSMSFKSLYSIKKNPDVTLGVIPVKCKTPLGHSVTAVLGNTTISNGCKAPSIGDAALCWCWFKAQKPTSPSARAVFAGHTPVPGGAWHVFVQRSQDDNMSCQKIGLCHSVPEPDISHVTGPPFSSCSATPCWDNHSWMCQIFPQVLSLTSSSSQSLELGVDSRSTVIERGLVPNKQLVQQPQACPCPSAVQPFLLFAFLVVSLFLWLPRVITPTDEKTLLGINTIINQLRIWFWSIWKMNSADFQRINLLLPRFYGYIQCSYSNKRMWILDLPKETLCIRNHFGILFSVVIFFNFPGNMHLLT